MRKKMATVTAHHELTVSSPWAYRELTVTKWSHPAVTEPWPGPWLSCDLAVTEPWSYWRCRDWAVTSPWLSCDLAVTELWHRRDWAVTSPSRDWAVIIGPGAVTTVSSPWAHGELTVSSRWQFFSHGVFWRKYPCCWTKPDCSMIITSNLRSNVIVTGSLPNAGKLHSFFLNIQHQPLIISSISQRHPSKLGVLVMLISWAVPRQCVCKSMS